MTSVVLCVCGTLVQAQEQQYEIHYLLLDTSTQGAKYQPNALLYKHIIPYNKIIALEGIVALGITEESERRKKKSPVLDQRATLLTATYVGQ